MKHLRLLIVLCAIGAMSASCSMTAISVNSNPVGESKGVSKAQTFSSDADYTLARAAKKGGVNKIGLVEMKSTFILFFVKITTTVTGD